MFGLLFGWVTRQVLKFIKRGGHKAPEQLALSLAMAYLVFYTSQVGKRPHFVLCHTGCRWSRLPEMRQHFDWRSMPLHADCCHVLSLAEISSLLLASLYGL